MRKSIAIILGVTLFIVVPGTVIAHQAGFKDINTFEIWHFDSIERANHEDWFRNVVKGSSKFNPNKEMTVKDMERVMKKMFPSKTRPTRAEFARFVDAGYRELNKEYGTYDAPWHHSTAVTRGNFRIQYVDLPTETSVKTYWWGGDERPGNIPDKWIPVLLSTNIANVSGKILERIDYDIEITIIDDDGYGPYENDDGCVGEFDTNRGFPANTWNTYDWCFWVHPGLLDSDSMLIRTTVDDDFINTYEWYIRIGDTQNNWFDDESSND